MTWPEYFNLDMDAFDACMESEKYYEQIIQDTQNAYLELEVTGTPTFVVNGVAAMVGNKGYQELAQVVEQALAAAGSD